MFPRGEHAAWRSAASTRRTTKSSKSTLPGTRKTWRNDLSATRLVSIHAGFTFPDSLDRSLEEKLSRNEWCLGLKNPFRRVAELNLEIKRHGRSMWRRTRPSSRQRSSTLWGRCRRKPDSDCRHTSNFIITFEGRCSCTIRMAFSWMPSWESIGKPTEGHYHSSMWNGECQF